CPANRYKGLQKRTTFQTPSPFLKCFVPISHPLIFDHPSRPSMDDSQPTGRWPVFNLNGTTMSGSVRADLCLTDAIVTIPSMGSWHSYKPETVTGCFLRIDPKRGVHLLLSILVSFQR